MSQDSTSRCCAVWRLHVMWVQMCDDVHVRRAALALRIVVGKSVLQARVLPVPAALMWCQLHTAPPQVKLRAVSATNVCPTTAATTCMRPFRARMPQHPPFITPRLSAVTMHGTIGIRPSAA